MWYERTEALIGKENIEKLKNSHVAVFGVGGVGSFVIEALARAGIGEITVIDGDVVCESNINRQLIATADVIGQPKVNVMQKRILSINPDIEVNAIYEFYTPDKRDEFLKGSYTYVVDAIDSVPNKIDLIKSCYDRNIRIISSMGAANKLNPAMFEVADISKTSVCPLAKVIRRKLSELNIKKLKVVYSKEPPLKPVTEGVKLGSISFVPSSAGLLIASEVIRDIIKI
jgi:tRNA A37 threonylcarbamoyladenosine dehydratase